MPCPCCLPRCCPAWRAFDGSDRFFRYLAWYDWDIPKAGSAVYTVTEEIDGVACVQPALGPDGAEIEVQVPLPRTVDGHYIIDATDACQGYANGASGTMYYGLYVSSGRRGPPIAGVGENGAAPGVSRPWRYANIFNFGGGLANRFAAPTEERESYTPASSDVGSYTAGIRGNYFTQKFGVSLLRYKLFGEYSSPPSPYCHVRNPLP